MEYVGVISGNLLRKSPCGENIKIKYNGTEKIDKQTYKEYARDIE